MYNFKYVFSQLVSFLDRNHFNYLVRKYNGDSYVKLFSCWNQLLVMIFGQLSNRESLRDVVLATQAHSSKAFHLGFGKAPTKSNLSKANRNRDYRIFEDFAYRVIAEAQIPTFFHITPARVHDTKVMELIPYEENSFYIFDRGYNDFKLLYNINSVGAFFVIRGKKNNDFKSMTWKRRFRTNSGILSDAIGYMDGIFTMEKYPDKIRRITYWDKEEKRKFIFFTNALNIAPELIAELYHQRWQIELFFKWLKQHLKIKKFWGESENAVRIQIYSAIIAYCMMAIVQKNLLNLTTILSMN